MPRILEVRGVVASNCSKLKAFMSDSKWKTQPGASSSWKFLSSQTMGHSLTFMSRVRLQRKTFVTESEVKGHVGYFLARGRIWVLSSMV